MSHSVSNRTKKVYRREWTQGPGARKAPCIVAQMPWQKAGITYEEYRENAQRSIAKADMEDCLEQIRELGKKRAATPVEREEEASANPGSSAIHASQGVQLGHLDPRVLAQLPVHVLSGDPGPSSTRDLFPTYGYKRRQVGKDVTKEDL